MKKHFKKIILLLLIIINISLFFVIKNNSYKNSLNSLREEFKNYETIPPRSFSIENNTIYPINDLLTTILSDLLEFDTLSVIIQPMPLSMQYRNSNYNTRAILYKNRYYEHAYLLLLATDIKPDEMERTLLHEAVHIVQYESGLLRIIDFENYIYVYNNDTIDPRIVDYKNRPYENDAFNIHDFMKNKLDSLLCK